MTSIVKRIIPASIIFLLFGGWSTLSLYNKGFIKNGFELGWIGFTDLKIDRFNAVVITLLLFVQIYYVFRAYDILSKAEIKSSFVLEIIIVLKVLYGLFYDAGFVFNLLQLLAFIGFGSAIQTIKKSRVISRRYIFSVMLILLYFTDLAVLSMNTGGRGHLFIPLVIFLASFRFKRRKFQVLLMVLLSLLLIQATFLKFDLQGDEWTVGLFFLLGRVKQMDSVYWVLQHPNSWRLSEYGLPFRMFEAMDYLNVINEIDIEKWLYSRKFSGDGGFAVHPFAEFIWTTKSLLLSCIFTVLLFEYTLFAIRLLKQHFKLIVFIGWYLLALVLLKPESLVIVGMYLFKYVPLLMVFNLFYEFTKTNIRQTYTDK